MTQVAAHITSLLTCQIEELPVEFFLHYFRFGLDGPYLHPYEVCMDHLQEADEKCNELLSSTCSGASVMCADRIKQAKYCQGKNNTCKEFNTDPNNKLFIERQACLTTYITQEFKYCQNMLRNICDSSGLKVSKVICMQMSYVEEILRHLPDVKVIHLVRDPRGMLNSQSDLTGWGMNDTKWSVQASSLCQRIKRDLDTSGRIQKVHPSALLSVRYEDLASNTQHVADAIYQHIGRTVPTAVNQWIHANTHGVDDDNMNMGTRRKNSTAQAYRWMDDITPSQLERVMAIPDCVDVIQRSGYHSSVEFDDW